MEEIFRSLKASPLEKKSVGICQGIHLCPAVPAQQTGFLNLATNANYAMPSGDGYHCYPTKDKAVITSVYRLRIEGKPTDKVFDPFYTTKENGTGLGLTISYGIIENHQGRIYVDSIPGKGTTFTIELPIIKNELQQ